MSAWSEARNLLCVRLDYLGDVLMCTPALRALKESVPGRRITLLGSGGGAAVAPHVPEIDEVITYAAPWMKHGGPHDIGIDIAMVERLRERGFDGAVIFTTYSQSALPAAMLCYLAGIPLRIAHCRENPYRLLSDWLPETEPQQGVRHEVRRQLDLVAAIGCATADERMSFALRQEDREWAQRQLALLGIEEGQRWVLMHPGATAASRRYPPAHWAAAARRIVGELELPIVFSGDAGEAMLIDDIRAECGMPTHSLAGRATLGQLGGLIQLASVMVANNTGPAHMAAAIGTPLVDLYAQTNLQHTPWRVESRVLYHDVPCRNCYKSVCPEGHHDCLAKVEPGRVVDAVRELLVPPARRELAGQACR
jgi:lipopolysaccharide heptosyltransferase II